MHALRIGVAVLLVAALGASAALAQASDPPQPAQPVVVKVEEGGFRWGDAGLGAAAGVAASLLVLALVFAVWRTGEESDGKNASRRSGAHGRQR